MTTTSMEVSTSGNRRELWKRGLYMLFFMVVYKIVDFVIILIGVTQFVIKMATGESNLQLQNFGQALSGYLYQIGRFQTFNTDARPYPFSPWPSNGP